MQLLPSPVPTPGPSAAILQDILRRQDTTEPICGFQTGNFDQQFSCFEGNQCATNLQRSAWGCCTSVSSICHIPVSCVDFSDLKSCGRDCLTNSDIMPCTDEQYPYCFTDFLDVGSGTILSQANCANGQIFGDTYRTTWTGPVTITGKAPVVKYVSVSDDIPMTTSKGSITRPTATAALSTTAPLIDQAQEPTPAISAAATASVATSPSSKASATQGLPTGIIAAIVIPIVVVVLLAIAAAVFLILRARKKRRQRSGGSNTDMWSPINSQRLQQLRQESRTSDDLARNRYLSGGFDSHEKPAAAPTVAGTIDDFVPHGG